MPLTPSTVKRSPDTSGDDIATFDNGSGQKVQAAALVDDNGNHIGFWNSPFTVDVKTSNLPNGAATDYNLAKVANAFILGRFSVNDVDVASATVTYVGYESNQFDEWLIKKIDTTSGVSVRYATIWNSPGNTTYLTAWTNRATLTYSRYYSAAYAL